MSRKIGIIIGIISSILILAITVGFSYAWYLGLEKDDINISGSSAGAYFYDGDGSSANPFKIADSRHMYNFAWLQNNGKLQDSDSETAGNQPYYFELWNPNDSNGRNGVINMKSVIIPPIGNDTYPFVGIFNGNGNKISNLVVSTNFDVIKNGDTLSSRGYKFSNAVGLFGMTGAGSEIKNFILDNSTVEVYASDSNYADSGTKVVGLAIGYVENKASSIGVIGGTLANRRDDNYSTYNSILGGMSDKAKNNMNVTGDSSGSNADRDKGYFIADDLYENSTKLSEIYQNSQFNAWYWLIPNSNLDVNSNLELGSFSVVGSKSSGDKCYEINSGNEITSFTFFSSYVSFDGSNNKDSNCITPKLYGASSSTGITIDMTKKNITDTDLDNQKDEASILANLVSPNSTESDKRIYGLKYMWRFKNSPQTYPVTISKVVDENNNLKSSSKKFNINDACLRVNISHASPSSPANIFLIARTANASADRYIGLKKVYNFEKGEVFNYEDFSDDSKKKMESEISKKNPDQALRLPTDTSIVGCYFEVTEPGVYCMFSTNSAVAFLYVSVVGVAEGQESTGSYSEDNLISGIDFITDTTSIQQTDGTGKYDFISSAGTYSYTKVKISYTSNMNGVVMYFKREDDTIAALLLLIKPNTNNVNKAGSGTCNPSSTDVELVIDSSGVTSTSPFNE